MSQETTYAGILGEWQRLLVPLKANSEALANLEPLRVKMEAVLERAVALSKEQAVSKATKQQATKDLRTLVPEGRRLATLLRAGVREHFGPRAEKLAEFNLQPFRGRQRNVKPAPDGPATTPGGTPTSPSTPLKATDTPVS
jgi:hypothetical protein